ncbi:conserved hypothetical protein, secreted [Candidatus Magnetomorum sp. HK-1]|nr:conserved hypothetical protein, secreted [Candidatus Magnetomorum sp. HK-1]
MKIKYIIFSMVFISIIWAINCISAEKAPVSKTDQAVKTVTTQGNNKQPVAVIPEPTFQSQPVIEGNDIIHDFVIKNTGGDTLNISRVKTG